MNRIIKININVIVLEATLNNSKTADAIWEALPITAQANIWGDEIYFGIPVDLQLENEQVLVELGDIAYWPNGNAFCIFFGPTPMSRGDEIRPASAVNVFGKITSDTNILKEVNDGAAITVERTTG